jgi:flagellar basal body-associated protein FliL
MIMKQKAQIDVLDLPLMEDDEIPKDIKDVTVDSEPSLNEGEDATPLPGKANKAKKKLLWIASSFIIVIIAVVTAGYFICFQQGEKKAVLPVVATGTPGQNSFLAVMDDFNIDVKDDKGNIRLLSCGFLLEMAPHEDGKSIESRLEIRKLIFDTLHRRMVSDLIKNDEKKAIKKEITDGVNRLLGAEKVKETYITKFLLL